MITTRRTISKRPWIAAAATAILAVGVGACGGGGESDLSEQAQQGRTTANSSGCASCHGTDGQGGVGPTWIDLAGSEVVLKIPEDEGGGTRTVTADDEYLRRAILDPGAEEVDGYTVKMPTNGLSESETDDVIAYIKELTGDE